jgi:hypothetical protein
MCFRKITLAIIIIIFMPIASIADDHGDTWGTATDIGILINRIYQNHVDFSGDIEISGDVDWFSFYATANDVDERYVITLTSWLFSNQIKGVKITLYDTDGATQITRDQESGCNSDGHLSADWKCSASGTYYIKVEGYENSCNTGEYLGSINIVSASDSSDSDDECFIASASYTGNDVKIPLFEKIISLLIDFVK